MTVRTLKAILEKYPDDARIYADDGIRTFEGNSEFIDCISELRNDKKIIFQTKKDIDVPAELEAWREYCSEEELDQYDAFCDLGELGYVLDDFSYDPDIYEWAKEFSETHSWYEGQI